MGHHQLEGLVRTPPYRRLIAMLAESANRGSAGEGATATPEQIAAETFRASIEGVERAKADDALAYCFYLLARITRAARTSDFLNALSREGVRTPRRAGLPDAPLSGDVEYSAFDLVCAYSEAVDRHLIQNKGRSDIGEIALS
jgi:hypothetical protein